MHQISLTSFLQLMCWMYFRTARARIAKLREQSRLLMTVLTSFILGYLLLGYFLFFKGLEFVYKFPIVGTLLSQRILYLIFGFFFLMLIFSNIITGYTTLFKNRETEWFLSMPVKHRHIYLWKFIESLVVSSWALIFLSAPMMAAYGKVHSVDFSFYWKIIILYIPFVVIPSVIGSWLILFIVRVLSRPWVKTALLACFASAILWLFLGINPTSEEEAISTEDVVSFEKLLQHTRLTLHPALPSSWTSRSIVAWSQNLTTEGTFYFLLILSYALFGVVLSYEVAGRFFYPSWSQFASNSAVRAHKKALLRRRKSALPDGLASKMVDCIPWLSTPVRSLIKKDMKIFWRDPSQWSQFVVFFGLLCIYVLNLRNVAYDIDNIFWSTTISYLNLGACSLTLSTLTTRFVFPQFSLEGRRLWIIGLAPIGVKKVLLQKFWTSCAASMAITITLMVSSSVMLKLSSGKMLFFAGSIALMSATLSALAVGLGALFPNLKEDNPSKIVSGFGGTLCLVISFIYITLFIALLALPASIPFTMSWMKPSGAALLATVCYLTAALMSLLTILIPMKNALHKVKNLEF